MNRLMAALVNHKPLEDHAENERALLKHIQFCQQVFDSDADWKYKYDRIFKIARQFIRPLLTQMGLDFDYYDPDTSYEEDVTAYMNALNYNVLPSVKAVLGEDDGG